MNWRPLKVLFIGDEPSSKNKCPNTPFAGTPSYKRLLRWIGELDLDISKVQIINCKQTPASYNYDKVIVLGKTALNKLLQSRPFMELHFSLKTIDHPSPRNRKFNKPGYEAKMLKDLKKWLYE